MAAATRPETTEPQDCKICGSVFVNRRSFCAHLKHAHGFTYREYVTQHFGIPTCACGCGKQTAWNVGLTQYSKFIRSHMSEAGRDLARAGARDPDVVARRTATRMKNHAAKITELQKHKVLCACGCGEFTKWHRDFNRYNTYLFSHAPVAAIGWNKGKKYKSGPNLKLREYWRTHPQELAARAQKLSDRRQSFEWRNSPVGQKELARLREIGANVPPGSTPRGVGGYRHDLPHFVRSTWEANLARVFMHRGVAYEYEPEIFDLPSGLRYIPDFKLTKRDGTPVYVEVKGLATEKWQRVRKEFVALGHHLLVVDRARYANLKRQYAHLIEWELSHTAHQHREKAKRPQRAPRAVISYATRAESKNA